MDFKISHKNTVDGKVTYLENKVNLPYEVTVTTEFNRSKNTYIVYFNGHIVRFYETSKDYTPYDLKSLHSMYLCKFYDWQGADPFAEVLTVETLDPMTRYIIEDMITESLVKHLQGMITYKDGMRGQSYDHWQVNTVNMLHYTNKVLAAEKLPMSNKPLFF